MATDNRSYDLLADVVERLRADGAVTAELPDGANDIHPGPLVADRDPDVALIVRLISGSATRRGRRTQSGRLVQVVLQASATHFETQPTRWPFDIFDAVEDSLEGLGGGGRAPDGRGGSIEPQFDPSEQRYLADATFRFQTIH